MSVAIEVGSFTKATATGNQDITIATNLTAAGNGTWAIMMWTCGSDQASGTADADLKTSVGFVANEGGSLVQFSTGAWAVGTTTNRRNAATIYSLPNSAGSGTSDEASFVSFPSTTSMRINWATNDANARIINYTIFSGLTHAVCTSWLGGSQGATSSASGLGFKPDLVFTAMPLGGTPPSNSNHLSWGWGAFNSLGQQWSNSFLQLTGGTTCYSWQATDALQTHINTSGGIRDEASFVSMDSGGWTAFWSTSFASGTYLPALAMKGISSKLGSFRKTASVSSQIIDSRHGFTVRGALFSSISQPPFNTGTVPVDVRWCWGASDLTNERVSAMTSQNGVSNNDSYRVSGKSILLYSAATPTIDVTGNISTTTSTSFTVAWSASTSTIPQVLYVLFGDSGATTNYPATIGT